MFEKLKEFVLRSSLEKYELLKPYLFTVAWVSIVAALCSYVIRLIWRIWIHPLPPISELDHEIEKPSNPFLPQSWELLIVFVGIYGCLWYKYISFNYFGNAFGVTYFLWNMMNGTRIAVSQLMLPRKPNSLADLPNHSHSGFVAKSWEYSLFLGISVGICVCGSLKWWMVLVLYLSGYTCGWIPAWFFWHKWIHQRSPKSVILWTLGLRRIGLRSEAVAMLELYANLKSNDYANLQILTSKLHGWLGQLLTQEPRYPLALGDALISIGAYQDIACLFQALFDIQPETYRDPLQLKVKLQTLNAKLPINIETRYVTSLAISLFSSGRTGQSLAVLEAYLETFGVGYAEPWVLGRQLREHIQSSPDTLGNDFFLSLMVLLEKSGYADSIPLFEGYLNISGEDYTSPNLAAEWVEKLQCFPKDDELKLGIVFVNVLSNRERYSEVGVLLSIWFGLTGESQDVAIVNRSLKQLSWEDRTQIINLLANLWINEDRQEVLKLLEEHLKLKSKDYTSSRRLWERLKFLSPTAASAYLMTLSNALSLVGRKKDSLQILEAYLWIDPKLYRNEKKLEKQIDDRLQYLPIENQFSIVATHVQKLMQLGRFNEALLFQHTHLKLQSIHYAQPQELAQLIYLKMQGVSSTTASLYLQTLVQALEIAHQSEKVRIVLDLWLHLFVCPSDPTHQNGIDPSILCSMFDYWLRYLGDSNHDYVLEICRFIIPQLRYTLVETGVTLDDRKRFIQTTITLRQRVIETGLYWCLDESILNPSTKLRLEVQLWDFELSQRILLERFLAGLQLSIPVLDDKADLKQGWTLDVEPMSLDMQLFPLQLERLGVLDTTERGGPSMFIEKEAPLSSSWLDQAKAIVSRGLSLDDLWKNLSPSTVLLRAIFLSSCQLNWVALKCSSIQIEIVAYGTGHPHDQYCLKWLNIFHDLQNAIAWSRLQPPPKCLSEMEKHFHSVQNCFTDFSKSVILPQAIDRLIETVQAARRAKVSYKNRLSDEVIEAFKFLALLPLQYSQLLREEPNLFVEHFDRLSSLIKHLDNAPVLERSTFDQERDRITAEYVQEVSMIWQLDALIPALDPSVTDLVLQLDDVLHAIPVAHLPVQGQPLFSYVRSIRESLAFLLNELQQDIEYKMLENWNSGNRLMTVSWFKPSEPSGIHQGAYQLHAKQSELAKVYGMEWYSASVQPPGSIGAVRSGLKQKGNFRVVTICGHGDRDRGVQLADTDPWRGQDCPLDQVDFLVLVSCSVGRIIESGTRDVEGLVVELAIYRARSVLACRWPIHCISAPTFANAVIENYLTLQQDRRVQKIPSISCLRAQAVNAARKQFLCDHRQDNLPYVGLNTIAAFELYGLG